MPLNQGKKREVIVQIALVVGLIAIALGSSSAIIMLIKINKKISGRRENYLCSTELQSEGKTILHSHRIPKLEGTGSGSLCNSDCYATAQQVFSIDVYIPVRDSYTCQSGSLSLEVFRCDNFLNRASSRNLVVKLSDLPKGPHRIIRKGKSESHLLNARLQLPELSQDNTLLAAHIHNEIVSQDLYPVSPTWNGKTLDSERLLRDAFSTDSSDFSVDTLSTTLPFRDFPRQENHKENLFQQEINSMRSEMNSVAFEITEIHDRIRSLSMNLNEMGVELRSVGSEVGNIPGAVLALQNKVEELKAELKSLRIEGKNDIRNNEEETRSLHQECLAEKQLKQSIALVLEEISNLREEKDLSNRLSNEKVDNLCKEVRQQFSLITLEIDELKKKQEVNNTFNDEQMEELNKIVISELSFIKNQLSEVKEKQSFISQHRTPTHTRELQFSAVQVSTPENNSNAFHSTFNDGVVHKKSMFKGSMGEDCYESPSYSLASNQLERSDREVSNSFCI